MDDQAPVTNEQPTTEAAAPAADPATQTTDPNGTAGTPTNPATEPKEAAAPAPDVVEPPTVDFWHPVDTLFTIPDGWTLERTALEMRVPLDVLKRYNKADLPDRVLAAGKEIMIPQAIRYSNDLGDVPEDVLEFNQLCGARLFSGQVLYV